VKEINFIRDTAHKMAAMNPFYKSNKVFTSDGMPPNSQVRMYQYRMYGPPRPVFERPQEQIGVKRGNATGALRGTTKAGVGAKNEALPGASRGSAPAKRSRAGPPRGGGGPTRGSAPTRGQAPTRAAPPPQRSAPPATPQRGGPAPTQATRGSPTRGPPRGAPRGAPRGRGRGGPPRGGRGMPMPSPRGPPN